MGETDLISRPAAYATALAMYVRCDTGNIEDYRDLMCESILALPPAQPEIIRCKDCKHSRSYKHTKDYVACEVDCEPIDRDSDFFCKYGEWRGEQQNE